MRSIFPSLLVSVFSNINFSVSHEKYAHWCLTAWLVVEGACSSNKCLATSDVDQNIVDQNDGPSSLSRFTDAPLDSWRSGSCVRKKISFKWLRNS